MSTLPPNSMIRWLKPVLNWYLPFHPGLCGQFALSSVGLSFQLSLRLHRSHSCSGIQNWDTVESRNPVLSIAFYCSTFFEKISSTSFIAIAFSFFLFFFDPCSWFRNQIWSIKISTDHILFKQFLKVLWLKNYFWPSSVKQLPKANSTWSSTNSTWNQVSAAWHKSARCSARVCPWSKRPRKSYSDILQELLTLF